MTPATTRSRKSPPAAPPAVAGGSVADGRVEHADIVILGAGLAGASLAWRLAGSELSHLKVIILEPRTEFPDDRTWCSWGVRQHPFMDDVTASWRRLAVRWPGGRTEIAPSCGYDCLPAGSFFSRALPRLEQAEHLSLRLGVGALGVREIKGQLGQAADRVVVDHELGQIEALCVFDSRPPEPVAGTLAQHFLGWQIETERNSFDQDCALLMDFDVPQEGAIHFMYVLPRGPRHALVETTWIEPLSRRPMDSAPIDYTRHLRAWIERHLPCTGWRIHGQEQGCLPMTLELSPRRSFRQRRRHVAIGNRGGALRPSSGYAFHRVQEASDHLAAQLRSEDWRHRGLLPPALDRRLDAFMDRVFLAFLRRRPERASEVFSRLFERCDTDRLVRFLSGTGSWRDRVAVMASLPPAPFILESLRGAAGAR